MDDLDDYEEIGGRCDMRYRCDICDEDEYQYDEDGHAENFVRMFRVGKDDVCEFCLKKILDAPVERMIEDLTR